MARSRSTTLDTPACHDLNSRAVAFRLRFGLAVVGLAIALTGCDSGTQEPDAPAPEAVEYSAPAEASPDAGADSGMSSEPVELPDGFKAEIPSNFPSNVPIPPGARPVLGRGSSVGDSDRTGVQLVSTQPVSDVFSFYETELEAGGWSVGELKEGVANAITATNGDDTVMLFVTSDPSGGSVVYMITESGGPRQ